MQKYYIKDRNYCEEREKIYWILKIDKTKDIRFCKRYIGTKEISLKENKKIIDKLYKQNINEISWIGEEAINYPYYYKTKQILTC